MCMDITETYDDIIDLRLLLYMRKAVKTHLCDRVEIRGLLIHLTNSCRHAIKDRN